jgi:hypothetical protein
VNFAMQKINFHQLLDLVIFLSGEDKMKAHHCVLISRKEAGSEGMRLQCDALGNPLFLVFPSVY